MGPTQELSPPPTRIPARTSHLGEERCSWPPVGAGQGRCSASRPWCPRRPLREASGQNAWSRVLKGYIGWAVREGMSEEGQCHVVTSPERCRAFNTGHPSAPADKD